MPINSSNSRVIEHCIATFAQSAGSFGEDLVESLVSTTGSIECTESSIQPDLQSFSFVPGPLRTVWCLSAVHRLVPASVSSNPQTIKAILYRRLDSSPCVVGTTCGLSCTRMGALTRSFVCWCREGDVNSTADKASSRTCCEHSHVLACIVEYLPVPIRERVSSENLNRRSLGPALHGQPAFSIQYIYCAVCIVRESIPGLSDL